MSDYVQLMSQISDVIVQLFFRSRHSWSKALAIVWYYVGNLEGGKKTANIYIYIYIF